VQGNEKKPIRLSTAEFLLFLIAAALLGSAGFFSSTLVNANNKNNSDLGVPILEKRDRMLIELQGSDIADEIKGDLGRIISDSRPGTLTDVEKALEILREGTTEESGEDIIEKTMREILPFPKIKHTKSPLSEKCL